LVQVENQYSKLEEIMKKPSVLREEKGFTLIELAIVLVIIGIILGAVLKGQDLIAGTRAKKFIMDAGKKWEIGAWTHFDRIGRFPGDADSNGLIGDGNPQADLAALNMTTPPVTPLTYGSFTFYVFLGSDSTGTPANAQNILVICKDVDCLIAFSNDELAFVQSFDTSIDGTASGTAGLVRATATTPTVVTLANYLATHATDVVSVAWTASPKALVYYFDRQPN